MVRKEAVVSRQDSLLRKGASVLLLSFGDRGFPAQVCAREILRPFSTWDKHS